MIVKCKYCLPKEGVEIPDFAQYTNQKLLEFKLKSPLQAIKVLMNENKLSHRDAKFIVSHINGIYGKCNHCDFNKLENEYEKCPKCGALNFNWKFNKETEK